MTVHVYFLYFMNQGIKGTIATLSFRKHHTPKTGPVLHSHESLPFYLLEKGEVTRFSPPKRVNIPLNFPKTSVSALLELLYVITVPTVTNPLFLECHFTNPLSTMFLPFILLEAFH